jgi:hypothetical protein
MLQPDDKHAWHLCLNDNATLTLCGREKPYKCLPLDEEYEDPSTTRDIDCEICYTLRCRHCGVWEDRHVDGKCLFTETTYVPYVPRSNEAVP